MGKSGIEKKKRKIEVKLKTISIKETVPGKVKNYFYELFVFSLETVFYIDIIKKKIVKTNVLNYLLPSENIQQYKLVSNSC